MRAVFLSAACLIIAQAAAARTDSVLNHWVTTESKVQLPVAWEITRSDFIASGMSSQSESFRESWALTIGPGFEMYLSSPRSRESVAAGRQNAGPMPAFLIVSDRALARLVGVPMLDSEEPGAPIREDLIILNITAAAPLGEEHTLKIAKDEFYAIRINFGW